MSRRKQEICRAIRAYAERAGRIAEGLSAADWQRTVYDGGWDAKRVYCHLASTAATPCVLVDLAASSRQETARTPSEIDAGVGQAAAERYDRPINEILAELASSCDDSIRAVMACGGELLDTSIDDAWGHAGVLGDLLIGLGSGHGMAHLDDLEKALLGG